MVDHGCDARHSHTSLDEERTSLRLTVPQEGGIHWFPRARARGTTVMHLCSTVRSNGPGITLGV